jgi:hypothetical protein
VKQNAACLPELLTTPTLEALLKVVERGNGESVKEIMEQTIIAVKEKKVDPTDILLRYNCLVTSSILKYITSAINIYHLCNINS